MKTTAPVLNDDAVLVILATAGHEGAVAEYTAASMTRQARLWRVRTELVARGLVEIEDGEYFVGLDVIEAATEAETERLRVIAEARRAAR